MLAARDRSRTTVTGTHDAGVRARARGWPGSCIDCAIRRRSVRNERGQQARRDATPSESPQAIRANRRGKPHYLRSTAFDSPRAPRPRPADRTLAAPKPMILIVAVVAVLAAVIAHGTLCVNNRRDGQLPERSIARTSIARTIDPRRCARILSVLSGVPWQKRTSRPKGKTPPPPQEEQRIFALETAVILPRDDHRAGFGEEAR